MKKLILILSILIAMVAHAKADNFVTDVMVIGGTQSETNALKTQYQNQGWTFVNKDLNQGAGGDYIYLLYKTDSDANPDATFITYFTWSSTYESQLYLAPGITYYPVSYDGGSNFVANHGNLNNGTNGFPYYLYYTKEANGGADNPHIVKSITFNNNPEGAMPGIDLNFNCGGNAPEIYMHPDITQGWMFWQGSDTECIIKKYDGPKAWITSYEVPTTHDGLYVIAADVFSGFVNLETLVFWENSHVTEMPKMQDCTKFKHVNVRLNNNVYSDQTPPSMTSIPDLAFYGTAIENLTMPSVTQVGDYAFEGCNLSSVTFQQSNVQIGNYAFANISDTCTVTYPGSANDWSPNAYVYSPNLAVNASDGGCGWCGGSSGTSENNLYWTLVNGHLTIDWLWPGSPEQQVISTRNWNVINVHSLTLNHVYAIGAEEFKDYTSLTTVTIGNGVTSIGNNAFYGRTGLASVTIGNSVTSIGNSAFEGCSNLASVTIGNSVTSIGNNAFNGCTGLTSVQITDLAAWCNISFGNASANPLSYAHHLYLNGNEITDLVIPNSVTSIGNNAFRDCTGLTSVTIPNSVTWIGSNAFNGCSGLTSVHISDLVAWCNISFGNDLANPLRFAHHLYLNNNEITDLVIPNSVTSIREWTFENCTGLTSLTIPNSVTSIGNGAFSGCTGLTSFTIPNIVTSIGNGAFSGCTGLTSVIIPNSVTSIGMEAFRDCSGLTSVNIGNSVTSIGANAFYGCTGLSSVTIPNSVTSIGDNVFIGCTSLTSVTINSNAILSTNYSSLSSLKTVFGNQVTSYTIGNNVTTIGENAFRGCTGLNSVTIPNSVTSIGNYAFYRCVVLKDLYFDGTEAQWNNVTKGIAWNTTMSSDYKEHWRCTVTFNTNSHGTAPAPQTNLWSKESKATQPTDPTESDYVFTGWYTNAQCTTPWNFSTDIVPGDMTLYAGWDLEVEGLQGSGTAEDPYLISNNGEWLWFAQSVANGTTYAGQTVKLAADIAATVMAGLHTSETDYHAFSGTFDGDGHTITLALSGSSHGTALFYHLGDATLKNLKVQGSVTTIGYRPATFASIINGNSTISNCWSTVAVSSTRANDWVDGGGFVGRVSTGASLNMTDCAFHGSVTFAPDATTGGGMVGYTQSNATVNLTNCLYSPTSLTLNVSQYNPRIFVSGQESGNLTNCYYNAVAAASVLANQGIDASDMTNEELVAALGPNWTITDGLVVPNWIRTFTKSIAGYGTGNGGWQLIAPPVGTVNPQNVTNMLSGSYDLYAFEPSPSDNLEWRNYKADTFSLEAGKGYLYAHEDTVALVFTGTSIAATDSVEVPLVYDSTDARRCWNLVGNPFPCAAYLDRPYYLLDADGTDIDPEPILPTTPIQPCTAVFVKAVTAGDTAVFGAQP